MHQGILDRGPKLGCLGLELQSIWYQGFALSLAKAGRDTYVEAFAVLPVSQGPLCSFLLALGFPFPHERYSDGSLEGELELQHAIGPGPLPLG